jgi:hypothetical protein
MDRLAGLSEFRTTQTPGKPTSSGPKAGLLQVWRRGAVLVAYIVDSRHGGFLLI